MSRVNPIITTFSGGEINPLLEGRTDLDWYGHACRKMRNMVSITEGAATRRPASRFVAEVADSSRKTIVRRFEFSTTQAYIIEFGHETIRFFANKGLIIDGMSAPIVVASPYLETELRQLKFVQSADVLFIFHPLHAPMQLERFSNTNWQLVALPFTDGPYFEINTDDAATLTPAATSGTGIALAYAGTKPPFAGTDIGRFVRLGYIAPDWAASTVYAQGAIVKNGANGVYVAAIAGTSAGAGGPTGTGLAIGDNTVAWNYVNAGGIEWGYAAISGFIDASNVTIDILTDFGDTTATSFWRLGLYSLTTGYPACGVLHQQRMMMAGSAADPDRIDASVTADYGNFTPGDTDSDPIAETLGLAGVDAIHWLASKRAAFLGTQGSVQKAYGTSGYDSAMTPSSFDVVEQVSRGALDLAPVRIINGLIYVHRLGRKILELYYDFTQDLDQATELTARARHLTAGGIVDMDYTQEPYSILWAVRADGALLGLTYYREQNFMAWHAHALGGGGVVESVAAIPGAAADQLWLVVRRTINGVTRRYVEVLDDFNAVEDPPSPGDLLTEDGDFLDTEDGDHIQLEVTSQWFFADSYAVYDGDPVTEISGLDYLEGRKVAVMADGRVVDGLTVASGMIALPFQANNVFVGLPYRSRLEPMPIEAGGDGGTSVGQSKKIDKLTVGLYRTGQGFSAGPDNAHLDPQRPGATELIDTVPALDEMDGSELPTPLFTGPYELAFDGTYDLQATVVITTASPLPLTVLWLVPRLATNSG